MTEDYEYSFPEILQKAKISLISLIGPDGAGKTTHVELLNKYLNESGVKARLIRVRAPHTLAYLLWRLFIELGICRIELNHMGKEFPIPSLKGSLAKRIWALIEVISILPHLLRMNYMIKKGFVLVADRYVIDSVATIAFFLNDKAFIHGFLAKVLLHFLPKNTIVVYLDADYETISQRRGWITEPRTFIDMQRYTYYYFEKIYKYKIIFTKNYSIQETHKILVQIIREGCLKIVANKTL